MPEKKNGIDMQIASSAQVKTDVKDFVATGTSVIWIARHTAVAIAKAPLW
jgi:hypothetical protein